MRFRDEPRIRKLIFFGFMFCFVLLICVALQPSPVWKGG
mgnify:CR=1 FL=1